jgi:1-acyl-sn-glycerol-3-phosphate acyltransferase
MDGKLQRARTGVARLALAAQVPVVPMGTRGTFEILPKWKKIPRLKKADLFIGNPLNFEEYYGKDDDNATLRKVTTRIMKAIGKLTQEEYLFDGVEKK